MRVAVIGATGHTGAATIDALLRRGHEVVAVARRPEAVSARTERVEVLGADVTDATALTRAFHRVDAVISTIGVGTSREPTRVYSDGATATLAAMAQTGVRRLVVVSAGTLAPRAEQSLAQRLLVFPILHRLFGASYEDMRRMEEVLDSSPADWTAVRPPRLRQLPGTGGYARSDDRALRRPRDLSYEDLGHALAEIVEDEAAIGRRVHVAGAPS